MIIISEDYVKEVRVLVEGIDVNISYATAKENISDALNKICLNSNKFGMHSLRPASATAAVNLGVIYGLVQKHGRWKSERVKKRIRSRGHASYPESN